MSEATEEKPVEKAPKTICQERGHHAYVEVVVCRDCKRIQQKLQKKQRPNRKQRRR